MNTPVCSCPNCHKVFDSVSNLAGGAMPVPGNYSLCLYCCTPLRFTGTLTVRALDELERLRLESCELWPEFQRVIAAIKATRPRRMSGQRL